MSVRAVDYLRIPEDYGRKLGGLRWAGTGEAVELPDGSTFALAPELASFVAGFAARGRLIHFNYVLHAFALLWKSRGEESGLVRPDERLREAFLKTGRRLRNAGVLFGALTESLPRTAAAYDADEVCRLLARSTAAVNDLDFEDDPEVIKGRILDAGPEPTDHLRRHLQALEAVTTRREIPPLTFDDFARHLEEGLTAIGASELESWLRWGEPLHAGAGDAIARGVLPPRPQLGDVLQEVTERPRFDASLPLLLPLASALTLPPRRLAAQDLPLGGYSDVTTRGQFEQVLPFQLALDELELVRRFASNELLFFRREEPRSRTREELVLVLDQGARTWGLVRVVLAAAALALGKLAAKRATGCSFAATSGQGQLLDPVEAGAAALGELIEASDLTLDPGATLEKVLESPATGTRDVVLLTHPRALREASVLAAARRAQPPLRLFAVTADERGQVELGELRHGAPVSLARLKVDLTPTSALPPKAKPRPISDRHAWRGDVESVPFPFTFGPGEALGARAFDFDAQNEWLLVAERRGLLFAHRLDGAVAEVWPRGVCALHDGAPLVDVMAVIGVQGGFAVCGRVRGDLVVAHYDLTARRCRTHVIAKHDGHPWSWHYYDHVHAIAVRQESRSPSRGLVAHAVDLDTGGLAFSLDEAGQGGRPRARMAVARAIDPKSVHAPPLPELSVRQISLDDTTILSPAGVVVESPSGRVLVSAPAWLPFTPLRDGRPVLQKSKPVSARLRGHVLALATWDDGPITQGLPLTLRLFRRDGSQRAECELLSEKSSYQLSHDGRYLARDLGKSRVEVRAVDGGAPVLTTTAGHYHHTIELILGDRWLAIEVPARIVHLVRWDNEQQVMAYNVPFGPGNPTTLEAIVARELAGTGLREPGVRATRMRLPGWLPGDPARWIQAAEAELIAVVDRYGHVCLFDKARALVAMIFVWRDKTAFWLPDGTRLGPPPLTGGPPSPNARSKVATALREAAGRVRARP